MNPSRDVKPPRSRFKRVLLGLVVLLISLTSITACTSDNLTEEIVEPQESGSAVIPEEIGKADDESEIPLGDTPVSNVPIKEEEKEENIAEGFERGKVTKHVDGDTVHITLDSGLIVKLRMIGVDTPETVHPSKPVEFFGKEASDYTKEQLFGKTVYLEKDVSDTDRYGRSLRYIWLEIPTEINKETIKTKMFNGMLVANGYASSATFQPDVKYQEIFTELAREARENNRGLWNEKEANKFNGVSSNAPIIEKDKVQTQSKEPSKAEVSAGYLGNTNSKKFHKADCHLGQKTSDKNRILFNSSSEAVNQGYAPCKNCNP